MFSNFRPFLFYLSKAKQFLNNFRDQRTERFSKVRQLLMGFQFIPSLSLNFQLALHVNLSGTAPLIVLSLINCDWLKDVGLRF